jgi:hypothetical protein
LKVDGKQVAKETHQAWSKGVDLATFATPMVEQAKQVRTLIERRDQLEFFRKREVSFNLGSHKSAPAAAAGLEALEKEVIEDLQKLSQPKPHRFELVKLAP